MRHYTLDEAQALLPAVIPVLERLREAFVRLRVLNAAVAAEARGASGDGNLLTPAFAGGKTEDRVTALRTQMRDAVLKLERWSIEVKDPERGLIDFRTMREGEVVYLCYLLGEPAIEWWHGLDAGFAGRQRL